MNFFLRKNDFFFTPTISNHNGGNFRGLKTAKILDSEIPATFMYNKAFLILKNKAKNSGIALQKDTLPEDEYLFFHSIKNQKKNYITSTNQFGGERFNLEDQMSVMLPSSNLESEAWRKLLREKTQLLRDSNNVAVYTQLEAMNQYKKTRQYCEERIDKFVSVIETSSHDAQIKFIEDELKTD